MMMLPGKYRENMIDDYQSWTKECVDNQDVSTVRLENAVIRILAVKLAMGLVQGPGIDAKPVSAETFKNNVTENEAWQDALKAAEESLVLLKNTDEVLPITHEEIKNIVFIGERTMDIRYGDRTVF